MALQPDNDDDDDDAARIRRRNMIKQLNNLTAICAAIAKGRNTTAINLTNELIQDMESRIIGLDEMMNQMEDEQPMIILDVTVQIGLAEMFDAMWDDFLDEVADEQTEHYLDVSGLTEEFEVTQADIDCGYVEGEVGDTCRRLTPDGMAVIRLAGESIAQRAEKET
jgi:hypothetical protein